MNYKTQEDLNVVNAIINEAEKGINDKSINMSNSKLLAAGSSFSGAAKAAITTGSALSALLSVSAFCIPGINILAGPVVLVSAFGLGKHLKEKNLRKEKELAYTKAIEKQNALIKALTDERNADKERIEYLTNINQLLEAAIKDLKNDLNK